MPFKVKAIYDYSSPHEDDLGFAAGQIINVTEEEDADWYVGDYTDADGSERSGLFPKNFVEKYEPAPPPRPARSTRPKQSESTPVSAPAPAPGPELAAPVAEEPPPFAAAAEVPEPEPEPEPAPVARDPLPAVSQPPVASPRIPQEGDEKPSAPVAKPGGKGPPPPVAGKSSAFKDRIAAFNNPSSAPIIPFKPGGANAGFVKKPFIAPPPSRTAYVSTPREPPPQKIYKREEDPEIGERQAQDQENAEKARLASSGDAQAADEEDAPKPQSLKERIALLQKQQMEQQRRAETAVKEKPKRPPKKRMESYDSGPGAEEDDLQKVRSNDTAERASLDESSEQRQGHVRKASQNTKVSETAQLQRELTSDNDADQSNAGETTEDADGGSTGVEEDDERVYAKPRPAEIVVPAPGHDDVGDGAAEVEEEEEDEMDEETRRKMELRERMAKMSGGMGMPGMFGMPMGGMGGVPPKKKKPSLPDRRLTDDYEAQPQEAAAPQRAPMIPMPGIIPRPVPTKSTEAEGDQHAEVEKELESQATVVGHQPADVVADIEDIKAGPPSRQSTGDRGLPPRPPQERKVPLPPPSEGAAPPIPSGRPVPPPPPPPPPAESRPLPPPTGVVQSPTSGSESDDEMAGNQHGQLPQRERPAPASEADYRSLDVTPMVTPSAKKRSSYMDSEVASPESMASPAEKRSNRPPPSIPPIASPKMVPPATARPPPPPPPTAAPPSRQATHDFDRGDKGGDEETEYEGDYDTDIASSAHHKDALKSHVREPSMDSSFAQDESRSRPPPAQIPSASPPVPSLAPRPVPPPPPQQPPSSRKSMDAPRGAPPPPPPRDAAPLPEDDEYDPYRYSSGLSRAAPPPPAPPSNEAQDDQSSDDDLYEAPVPLQRPVGGPPPPPPSQPPPERSAPPPPPPASQPPAPSASFPPPPAVPPSSPPPSHAPRRSLEAGRLSTQQGRRSMDPPRPSTEHGYIAGDVDLGGGSMWWTQPNVPPPVFQNRSDVLFEVEESGKRGGGASITKEVYVLFQDYSQTVVTASFDARNPADASLEQRHEPPPPPPRKDQLEQAHADFGSRLDAASNNVQNTVVGDGTPAAFVNSLLAQVPALKPIGTRAYGALVYANLANATVTQHDEIRPGDIVTFRNARFQGKHGAMHAKYSADVGKPDHVAVVVDWDGTKKKVRASEQGRESKKVKVESFRVGDLRSGEVRVWRVMGRKWVGWE